MKKSEVVRLSLVALILLGAGMFFHTKLESKAVDIDPDAAYRDVYWKCYDGTSKDFPGNSLCKRYVNWKEDGEKFCENACNNKGDCGLESIDVSDECAEHYSIIDWSCHDGSGSIFFSKSKEIKDCKTFKEFLEKNAKPYCKGKWRCDHNNRCGVRELIVDKNHICGENKFLGPEDLRISSKGFPYLEWTNPTNAKYFSVFVHTGELEWENYLTGKFPGAVNSFYPISEKHSLSWYKDHNYSGTHTIGIKLKDEKGNVSKWSNVIVARQVECGSSDAYENEKGECYQNVDTRKEEDYAAYNVDPYDRGYTDTTPPETAKDLKVSKMGQDAENYAGWLELTWTTPPEARYYNFFIYTGEISENNLRQVLSEQKDEDFFSQRVTEYPAHAFFKEEEEKTRSFSVRFKQDLNRTLRLNS